MALMNQFVPWANSQTWVERYFWNQAVSCRCILLQLCCGIAVVSVLANVLGILHPMHGSLQLQVKCQNVASSVASRHSSCQTCSTHTNLGCLLKQISLSACMPAQDRMDLVYTPVLETQWSLGHESICDTVRT